VLSGAAAGSAAWFITLQTSVIGQFCLYCMATHATSLLLAALLAWRVRGETTREPADAAQKLIGHAGTIGLPLTGIALAGMLALCQVVFPAPGASRGGESREPTVAGLDPHKSPIVGSPDAPYVVTLLFDYKCPHCQRLHAMLADAIERSNGKLAFVLGPAPLNNLCNPYIARQVDEFKDSCDLAKLGLAVWAARPAAFAAFDDWMFTAEPDHLWHPRTLEAARAKAEELVGKPQLEAALTSPWIDTYMQASVRIYGNTTLPDQSGNAVPKLVLGMRWVTPEPRDADDLLAILHDGLGIPNP
jgi:protein-disulfide isomerase